MQSFLWAADMESRSRHPTKGIYSLNEALAGHILAGGCLNRCAWKPCCIRYPPVSQTTWK